MTPIIALLMWWQVPFFTVMMEAAKNGRPDPNPAFSLVSQALSGVIILPMAASLAVAWNRLLLLNEHVSGAYLRFDGVVVSYAILFFLIGLLPAIPQHLGILYQMMTEPTAAARPNSGAQILAFAGTVLSIGGWFISGRLLMVLPARALEREDVTFGTAWKRTRKNTWRLFWGYLLCLLPVMILGSGLTVWLFLDTPSRLAMTVVWTLLTLVWALFGMVGVGFLSLAYRHFFGLDHA
jgi:hypothetical protein